MTENRSMPCNIEAEKALLGAVLLRNEQWDDVSGYVEARDFFRQAHETIWTHLARLSEQRAALDFVTLCDALRASGKLDAVGGPSYLAGLTDGVARSSNAVHYAGIVREDARRRRLVYAARQVEALALNDEETADDVIQKAEQALLDLGTERKRADFRTAADVAGAVYGRITAILDSHGAAWGIPTGFASIDRFTRGLVPATMIVLAARPAMGKSALALNIADRVAQTGRSVAFFSLEMSDEELGLRDILGGAGIGSHRLMRGSMSQDELGAISTSVARFSNLPIHFQDEGDITVLEMRSKCRRLAAREGLDLVVIDYAQLVTAGRRRPNRQEEVSEISRGFKQLAKELQIPVLVLSQLNRECEKRADKRPMLSDLRETGALEQDADMVWLLFRAEEYERTPENAGRAELIVAKQRNGPTGTVDLTWRAAITQFEDAEWRT